MNNHNLKQKNHVNVIIDILILCFTVLHICKPVTTKNTHMIYIYDYGKGVKHIFVIMFLQHIINVSKKFFFATEPIQIMTHTFYLYGLEKLC